jgi:hypothetical protein
MEGIIGAGIFLFGLALAERKGLVDKERFRLALTLGMNLGIMIGLLYFIYMLKDMFF